MVLSDVQSKLRHTPKTCPSIILAVHALVPCPWQTWDIHPWLMPPNTITPSDKAFQAPTRRRIFSVSRTQKGISSIPRRLSWPKSGRRCKSLGARGSLCSRSCRRNERALPWRWWQRYSAPLRCHYHTTTMQAVERHVLSSPACCSLQLLIATCFFYSCVQLIGVGK
jgi:hypothetical protein